MGRWMCSTGMKVKPRAWKDVARKSQYLKNSRSNRLKNMEEATASLAYLICPFPLKCSTSIPWVKSMAVDRNMMAT